MTPEIDLVIAFRATRKTSLVKRQAQADARKAEEQYTRLIKTLTEAGLRAVGRRGESLGHLLVFVSCPKSLLQTLVRRERQSDFLHGLPATSLTKGEGGLDEDEDEDERQLSPAERIRLVHAYIASMPSDGGLGVSPDSTQWDLVESIMALHDKEFNEHWVHAWTHSRYVSVKQEHLREQFGDSVALYFSFLNSYTQALVFPAALGVFYFFFGTPYSPVYSVLLVLWSVVFVEWWRIRERILSLRFGTRGSFRVEKRRAQYIEGMPWWKHELRMVAGLPVILLFAGILAATLTAIFVFEAFVTQLYTGPGHKYISFSPTILFAALVPRLISLYQMIMTRLTKWENHAHQSSHAASLTLKTFALGALVSYLGLALSAFVYVPFGEGIMRAVQAYLWSAETGDFSPAADAASGAKNVTMTTRMWNIDTSSVGQKLNARRLRDQMFAYTVTNQVVNTFMEIGLPFVLRGVQSFRKNGNGKTDKGKKRVVFEDEQEKGGQEERDLLEQVRQQVELPEYGTFEDYSEMVTQFGYVALWSTIWPLAPVMALVNNFFELRSDAFKITVHNRRPLPARTDTIGPWLDTLSFLTWLGALTNSALVYLFCPRSQNHCHAISASPNTLDRVHQHIMSAAGVPGVESGSTGGSAATRELLGTALLIALAASHGYILVRAIVRRLMEKAMWNASSDVRRMESEEREVKARFLAAVSFKENELADTSGELDVFWENDEGLQEIQRITKSA
ncbi:unnamed protein product [Mycena citricolor]|uniref:DUF590-domain-containing protein n=1 Tax=Mycena citricolor TaxID=2018698 RepID=A0AAD2HNG3_9AGAR|nr:unnamed protein product [Mycena citricolor]